MIKRLTIFGYGICSYAVFFATFLYAIGFIGDFGVPKTIDGAAQMPLVQALLINVALLGLFAIQHSVMARPAFKRRWTKIVPQEAERSTYVLFSSLALILLFAGWQPLGGVVWTVSNPIATAALYSAYAFGWALVLISTFLINHFDLFGLRQVWLQLRGTEYTPLKFKTPGVYKLVRHPLYTGWLFAFWATPHMTVAHFVFAAISTAYILAAIQFEERDLAEFHPQYKAYKRKVPMLFPSLRRRNQPAKQHPVAV